MRFAPLLLIAGILVSFASAQLTGSTILQILNTTQLSPAYEFVRLLNSSTELQPVLQLLNQTGNFTVFVPSDKFYKAFEEASHKNRTRSSDEGSSNNSSNQTTNATSTVPPSPFPSSLLEQNFTMVDLVRYHIVNSSFLLHELTNQTTINSTLSNNETTSKFPGGLPLLIQSNVSDPSNATQVGFKVGNGRTSANVVLSDILASNGVLHVIDNVLLPPQAPTEVIKNISAISELAQVIERFPQFGTQLNSTSNFTLFAPNNAALSQINTNGMNNQTIENMVRTYFLEGVYYTTNFTEAAGGNGTTSVTTAAGSSLPITVNGTHIKVNNTINVVQSNVLMDNGVMHIIDKALSST
ncbi:hypothetical protein DFQ28_002061 [Apophysomyces sp. BC1034]|nr:hypothetical protein DFQ30_002235 [Apophysomyces sp. BC1015]KAG0179951.1 hypothetical protein DFQ29_001459 [Apophysomyces sp. BC1021]KAG0190431.1 hypothetical protein DFQ28_002061 [Apophysomyces sp. BC1034]